MGTGGGGFFCLTISLNTHTANHYPLFSPSHNPFLSSCYYRKWAHSTSPTASSGYPVILCTGLVLLGASFYSQLCPCILYMMKPTKVHLKSQMSKCYPLKKNSSSFQWTLWLFGTSYPDHLEGVVGHIGEKREDLNCDKIIVENRYILFWHRHRNVPMCTVQDMQCVTKANKSKISCYNFLLLDAKEKNFKGSHFP